jgi:transketolase
MIDKLGKILVESGKKYGNMAVLAADFSEKLGLKEFSIAYGERMFNFGLAEVNMMSASVGFSVRGKMPVIVGMSNFLASRGLEQIRNGICVPNLNVKIIGVNFEDNGYEDLEDLAILKNLPNMKVVHVKDKKNLKKAISKMFEEYGPGYLRIG